MVDYAERAPSLRCRAYPSETIHLVTTSAIASGRSQLSRGLAQCAMMTGRGIEI